MIKDLWNIGIKVTDLDREVAFLEAAGAELLLREKIKVGDGVLEYAMLKFGGVRILAFPTVAFENKIAHPVFPGLTHAVYETDNFDREYQHLQQIGAAVLIEPTFVQGGFGSRRLAFFESPGGFVFEIIEVLSDFEGGTQ